MNWLWLLGDEDLEQALLVKVVKGLVRETFPYIKGNPHRGKPLRQLMSEFEQTHGPLTVEIV